MYMQLPLAYQFGRINTVEFMEMLGISKNIFLLTFSLFKEGYNNVFSPLRSENYLI